MEHADKTKRDLVNFRTNKIILILFVLTFSSGSFAQNPTVLFSIQHGGGEFHLDRIIAVPFVIITNGNYKTPPTCYNGGGSGKLSGAEVAECSTAKQLLLPVVQKGQSLYEIRAAKQTGTTKIIGTIEYDLSDWIYYSGELETDPGVKVLTNNKDLGKNQPGPNPKTLPVFKVRLNPDFDNKAFKNTLIERLDLDGDGISELIYRCEDYEGNYFQIYSYKNMQWNKVYSGGYLGI